MSEKFRNNPCSVSYLVVADRDLGGVGLVVGAPDHLDISNNARKQCFRLFTHQLSLLIATWQAEAVP